MSKPTSPLPPPPSALSGGSGSSRKKEETSVPETDTVETPAEVAEESAAPEPAAPSEEPASEPAPEPEKELTKAEKEKAQAEKAHEKEKAKAEKQKEKERAKEEKNKAKAEAKAQKELRKQEKKGNVTEKESKKKDAKEKSVSDVESPLNKFSERAKEAFQDLPGYFKRAMNEIPTKQKLWIVGTIACLFIFFFFGFQFYNTLFGAYAQIAPVAAEDVTIGPAKEMRVKIDVTKPGRVDFVRSSGGKTVVESRTYPEMGEYTTTLPPWYLPGSEAKLELICGNGLFGEKVEVGALPTAPDDVSVIFIVDPYLGGDEKKALQDYRAALDGMLSMRTLALNNGVKQGNFTFEIHCVGKGKVFGPCKLTECNFNEPAPDENLAERKNDIWTVINQLKRVADISKNSPRKQSKFINYSIVDILESRFRDDSRKNSTKTNRKTWVYAISSRPAWVFGSTPVIRGGKTQRHPMTVRNYPVAGAEDSVAADLRQMGVELRAFSQMRFSKFYTPLLGESGSFADTSAFPKEMEEGRLWKPGKPPRQ